MERGSASASLAPSIYPWKEYSMRTFMWSECKNHYCYQTWCSSMLTYSQNFVLPNNWCLNAAIQINAHNFVVSHTKRHGELYYLDKFLTIISNFFSSSAVLSRDDCYYSLLCKSRCTIYSYTPNCSGDSIQKICHDDRGAKLCLR